MKLYELLNINRENCFLLYPYQDEQERIKKLEMEKSGTLKHFNMAMKYEAALAGLLSVDRKEVIKSFNKLEYILVDIDIINFNYNNTALVLALYYEDQELLNYCIEMYKLFIFYKQPVHQWITRLIENPQIAIEGKKNLLYDDDLLNNLCLFPEFGILCESNIEHLQKMQTFDATADAMKAQMNIWDNTKS